MSNVCAWCDRTFNPTQYHHKQPCCSRTCGQHLRFAKQRRETGHKPPRETNWRNYPTRERPYKGTHQRLREELLPRAIGKVCPFYTTDPKCPGLMLQHHRLALDHRIPVALGGQTTLENVRIAHHDCNQRAGSKLGGTVRSINSKRYKQ
jgi:5-methylcytosine-specific restriction endonuclease McrA